jgi:glycine dehydrogenase subunit 1
MPFIPHTDTDIKEMLDTIGVANIEALFDEIPESLRAARFSAIPEGLTEMEMVALLKEKAAQDGEALCFIGAGAYEHHIPAAVWEIAGRGEFMTAYTPYQAEASQGTLQLLYEYQTLMSRLMAMECSNASLYDGASALAEAVLMAVRANRDSTSRRVLMPQNLHPAYQRVVDAIVSQQGISIVTVPYDSAGGHTNPTVLQQYAGQDFAALVIAQPNFFGVIEEVDALTDFAHQHKALAIAVVNPVAMALLAPPGEWGETGADIVCGEGQPLGVPLASGGPYFGFMCAKQALIRQMPGRIIGRTVDMDGKQGFALTLQAREQHIRRSKATSNICTNQGLLVTAATIHMSLLGAEGLRRVALAAHANTEALVAKLIAIPGVTRRFNRPSFHEVVLTLPGSTESVLPALAKQGILGGFALSVDYPALDNSLLVCVTETKTHADIERYETAFRSALTTAREVASS